MSTQHTPGPWRFARRSESEAYGSRRVISRNSGLIAVAWSSFKGEQDIADANARLIAAAPELLAALVNAVGALKDASYACDPLEAIAQGERAINKAKGE